MTEKTYLNIGRYRIPVHTRKDSKTGQTRYRVRLTRDVDPSGHRRNFDITDTSIEGLTAKLENTLHPYHYLMSPEHSTILFKKIAELWYRDGCITWVIVTQKSYRGYLDNYVLPITGDLRLVDVTTSFLQPAFNKLAEAGVTPSVLQGIRNVFCGIFQYCIAHKYLLDNPGKYIRIPKRIDHPQEALSEIQQNRLLNAFKDNPLDENIIASMLFTGGRVEEVLGLTWDHLDENSRMLTFEYVLAYKKEDGKRVYYLRNFTKNRMIRHIMLTPTALQVFRNQRDLQHKMKQNAGGLWYEPVPNLIFTGSTGDPIRHNSFGNWFRKTIKNKLPDLAWVHPYSLRHTAASNFYHATHNIVLTGEFLGHKDPKSTLNYTHSRYEDKAAVAEIIDSLHERVNP